jgi:energy-coupling factor transport system substrate-specific component
MIGYFPALITFISLFSGILCGIPFMLFLTRVKAFGMVSIFAVVCGLLSLLMGSGFWPLITAVIAGPAADFILRSGKYTSGIKSVLAYMVFCMWATGYGIRLYVSTSNTYIDSVASTYGNEYTSAMVEYVLGASFWFSILLTLLGGLLGGLFGRKVLKKHFVKAGIV